MKENNTLIAIFMKAEKLLWAGSNEILWQNCLLEQVNGNPVDSELYINKDWNQIMQVIQRINNFYYKGYPIIFTIGTKGAHVQINEHNVTGIDFIGDRIISNTLNRENSLIENV